MAGIENGHIVDCVRRREITFQPRDLPLLARSVLRPARGSLCWPRSCRRAQIKWPEIRILFFSFFPPVVNTPLSSDDLSYRGADFDTLLWRVSGLRESPELRRRPALDAGISYKRHKPPL